MSDKRMQYPERSNELNTLLGWLKEFFGQFKLAWELLWDGRVPIITKVVPLVDDDLSPLACRFYP